MSEAAARPNEAGPLATAPGPELADGWWQAPTTKLVSVPLRSELSSSAPSRPGAQCEPAEPAACRSPRCSCWPAGPAKGPRPRWLQLLVLLLLTCRAVESWSCAGSGGEQEDRDEEEEEEQVWLLMNCGWPAACCCCWPRLVSCRKGIKLSYWSNEWRLAAELEIMCSNSPNELQGEAGAAGLASSSAPAPPPTPPIKQGDEFEARKKGESICGPAGVGLATMVVCVWCSCKKVALSFLWILQLIGVS